MQRSVHGSVHVLVRSSTRLHEGTRGLAHNRVARVAHDEALAPELAPCWHITIVNPNVEHVPQLELRSERLGQLLASAARDHESAAPAVLERPAVHLFRAGPATASRGVQVKNKRLTRDE